MLCLKGITKWFALTVVSFALFGCSKGPFASGADKVKFEVKDVSFSSDSSSTYKSFTGTVTIVANGEGEHIKKPYIVLLKYEKTKGGVADEKKGVELVVLTDGLGKFKTYDASHSEKEKDALEKPEYKFEIIGFMPLIPVEQSKDAKVSFNVSPPEITEKKEEFVSQKIATASIVSYVGKGSLVMSGAQEKSFGVALLNVENTAKDASSDKTDNYKITAIVDGFGTYQTEVLYVDATLFGVQMGSKKEKPQYKVNVLGYALAS